MAVLPSTRLRVFSNKTWRNNTCAIWNFLISKNELDTSHTYMWNCILTGNLNLVSKMFSCLAHFCAALWIGPNCCMGYVVILTSTPSPNSTLPSHCVFLSSRWHVIAQGVTKCYKATFEMYITEKMSSQNITKKQQI